MKDLFVINVTMFKDLYGILAPLVKTDRIAINTMAWAQLRKRFNASQAYHIKEARLESNGFKDKTDFETRMAEKGVHIKGEQWEAFFNECDF